MAMDDSRMRQVLQRAEELQHEASLDPGGAHGLLDAAEEAGLSREAVMQALRERMELETPIQEGSLVFARSADGHMYAARIVRLEHGVATVKFLLGGEAKLPANEIETASFVPGATIDCPWPDWGWWRCRVISYNAGTERILVSDRMSEERTFHISEVRLRQATTPGQWQVSDWIKLAAVALGGGIVGALIMRLLMR